MTTTNSKKLRTLSHDDLPCAHSHYRRPHRAQRLVCRGGIRHRRRASRPHCPTCRSRRPTGALGAQRSARPRTPDALHHHRPGGHHHRQFGVGHVWRAYACRLARRSPRTPGASRGTRRPHHRHRCVGRLSDIPARRHRRNGAQIASTANRRAHRAPTCLAHAPDGTALQAAHPCAQHTGHRYHPRAGYSRCQRPRTPDDHRRT